MNENKVSAEFIVRYINSKVTNKIINETDVTKFERIAKEASELFYREKAGELASPITLSAHFIFKV